MSASLSPGVIPALQALLAARPRPRRELTIELDPDSAPLSGRYTLRDGPLTRTGEIAAPTVEALLRRVLVLTGGAA